MEVVITRASNLVSLTQFSYSSSDALLDEVH